MTKKNNKKVIVAMSGGVDSSVAAFLLQNKGYDVMGVFMRLGVDQGSAEDAARRVCQKLGIKFYPFNIAPNFKKEVIKYFLDSYEQGLTPNPCIKCNKFIKFGELLKLADQLGAEFLATGHYVKNQKSKIKNLNRLLRGNDQSKDQSYFLYNLTQDKLKRILFPLGNYRKEEVKKIAKKNNLPVQESESQDVCFLQGDHNDFLREKINLKPGKIILINDEKTQRKNVPSPFQGEGQGEVVGEHKGLPLYTVGQRRGVEIGGTGPYYVVRVDYKNNILYVSKDRDDPLLYTDKLTSVDTNWVSGNEPKLPFKCKAVIRYRHKPVECIISKIKLPEAFGRLREANNSAYLVELKKPERAVTPGQSVVFYKGDEVLGGGIISVSK